MENNNGNTSSAGNELGFFAGCKAELKKVVKPTREETMQATWVTIIILVFVAVSLFLFDVILKGGLYSLLEMVTGQKF